MELAEHRPRNLAQVFCALLFVASIAIAQPRAPVEYRGQTLVVEGIAYERDSTVSDYGPGLILVAYAGPQGPQIEEALLRFNLRIADRWSAGPMFGVVVPNGFETQWVAASRALPGVTNAWVNARAHPN